MKTIGILFLLVVGACAERAEFRPTGPSTHDRGDKVAASYDIRMNPETDPHTRVSIWSRGATIEGDHTIVGVGLEIRNTGDQPVTLRTDELELDAYSNQGAPLPASQLSWVGSESRTLEVAPGEATRMELKFAMPTAIDPDRIGSLRLRWAVDYDGGQRYVQFTDFQRVHEEPQTAIVYYDPIWSYYDPFLYGPPYTYHHYYRVPVRRIYVQDHDDHRDRDDRSRVQDHRQ